MAMAAVLEIGVPSQLGAKLGSTDDVLPIHKRLDDHCYTITLM
jgi:hypothetical protein